MDGFHIINGIKTDILVNAELLIDTEEDIIKFAKYLSEDCNITIEEAEQLLREHI